MTEHEKIKVHIDLDEGEINTIIHAIDTYFYKTDDDTGIKITRRLHTALTLARIEQIDTEK